MTHAETITKPIAAKGTDPPRSPPPALETMFVGGAVGCGGAMGPLNVAAAVPPSSRAVTV